MSNIDQTEAGNMLAASLGLTSYTATTTPLKGRLGTTTPTATSNMTEVSNSGGSTYASQTVNTALGSVSAGAVSNSSAITWTNLPTATITALELWDSAGTPKRKWFGLLAASKSVLLGDSLTLAIGALNISIA